MIFLPSIGRDVQAFRRTTGAKRIAALDDLCKYVRGQGLINSFRCYPMSGGTNYGTGSNIAGIGGLNTADMVAVNGPTWGTDGLAHGATSYLYFDWSGFRGLGDCLVFHRFKPAVASAADTNSGGFSVFFGNFGSASGGFPANTAYGFGPAPTSNLSLENWSLQRDLPAATGGRLGTVQANQSWAIGDDVLQTLSMRSNGTRLWKATSAITISLASVITTSTDIRPSAVSYSTDNRVFVGAFRSAGSVSAYTASRTDTAWAVLSGNPSDAIIQGVQERMAAL